MIDELLGTFARRDFIEQFFLKRPFALAGGAAAFTPLGTWKTLERICACRTADVMVVKQGERVELPDPPGYAELRCFFSTGHTLLVRHAEQHDPALAELAAGFQRDFRGAVDVHLYCTPAAQRGFGWHYDAEDVFILQTAGSKEYSLRKNTVNPWPLVETLPSDMRYPSEIMPLARCRLQAGDWLYIPAGYWHQAQAADESISLAVGVLPPVALDIYDFLRRNLADSLRWRQRLPVPPQAGMESDDHLIELYRPIVADLAEDLRRALADEGVLKSFLASRRQPPS